MATQKPISTISYNTVPFLREKLETWRKAHIIQSWMFIFHHGEENATTGKKDKDHIHLRVEPNKSLDQMNLTEALEEYDPSEPLRPLSVRPWRPSKEADWVLYAVHYPEYMLMKYGDLPEGEKIPYEYTAIEHDEALDLDDTWARALQSLAHSAPSIMKRLQAGERPTDLVNLGENPFTLSTLARLQRESGDYAVLRHAYEELRTKYEALVNALDDGGFSVTEDKDNPYRLHIKARNPYYDHIDPEDTPF